MRIASLCLFAAIMALSIYLIIGCIGNVNAMDQVNGYTPAPRSEGFLTFILAGQSNASGRGELNSGNETSDPRVLLFGNDYVSKLAYEPIDDPAGQLDSVSDDSVPMSPTRGHSFALRAAKELLASTTETITIVPCPKGASTVDQWRRGAEPLDRDTLFGSCNYRRSIATADGQATAMWWYQGESDANNAATYAANHSALIGEFREEFSPDLPIIYVQLARHTNSVANSNQHVLAEIQRQLESNSGHPSALANHFMVAAFDLSLADSIHIDQAALKELGRRVGLATRQHVLGEPVDGTGPRLLTTFPLIHPDDDKSLVLVRFNQPINETANAYEDQFRIYDGAVEIIPTSVGRAPLDDTAILIALPAAVSGTATLSYGDVPAPGLGTSLPGVVKGTNDLPAPRFGPIEVETGYLQVQNWEFYQPK
jgi:carbohydrate esterase-like sialic acid-specific acetylesterase